MRTGISFTLSPADRRRLTAVVGDRNAPQKHVWRASIIQLSANGAGTVEIMRRTGKSKTCVWRWQERFVEEGFEGLLRDKTRPSRIPSSTTMLPTSIPRCGNGSTVMRVLPSTSPRPPVRGSTPSRASSLGSPNGASSAACSTPSSDLQAAINRFIAEYNVDPKPFKWSACPDRIIAACGATIKVRIQRQSR